MNWKTNLFMIITLTIFLGCTNLPAGTQKDSSRSKEPEGPKLLSPKVRRVWVPEKIEGDKYFDGHYMYIIEKQTTWSN